MHKKIPSAAYEIAFDKVRSRFFLVGRGNVRVFDVNTNEKIAVLRGIPNPSQVFVSQKNGIIAVKSTEARFAFYGIDTFELLGLLKIRGAANTDPDFYYDEDENMLYGLTYYKTLDEYLYQVSPATLNYSTVPLKSVEMKVGEGEKPYTRYRLHKHENGGAYLIRSCYNLKRPYNKGVYESCYGRYELENGEYVLKEKYISTNEYCLDLKDFIAPEAYRRFCAYLKDDCGMGAFYRVRRCEKETYFIHLGKAVYRERELGEFETVFEDKYTWDYAEFQGRTYACTWEYCMIRW
ncbi:MAG: hypothetical protein J6A63_09225 [Clostridia bacterium]|nr:hypothetical protein [Clostridia bacterium]